MVRTLIRTKNYSLEVMRARLPGGVLKRVTYVRYRPNVIAVLPVLSNDRVILSLEYRPLLKRYIYSVVTGKVNRGETYAHAAARELEEETGYRAKRLTLLFKFYVSPGQIKQHASRAFLAEGLTTGKMNQDVDEVIKLNVMRLTGALQLIKTGKVIDTVTISSVLFYANFIKKRFTLM